MTINNIGRSVSLLGVYVTIPIRAKNEIRIRNPVKIAVPIEIPLHTA